MDAVRAFSTSGLTCDDVEIIDIGVAVFYTLAARRDAGGKDNIRAMIDERIVETNDAYRDSGVHQRLVLVHRAELDYTEAGISSDVDHLAQRDGVIDGVHAIRDAFGADVVHMLVGGPLESSCGGVLYDPEEPVEEANAFSVSHINNSCKLTFAHELGHNMGLRHDWYTEREVEQSLGPWLPYIHSAGYVNQHAFGRAVVPHLDLTGIDAECWYTIVAYDRECTAGGLRSQRIARFSNPRQTYGGDPLGIPDRLSTPQRPRPIGTNRADAVRSLNATRRRVANFRLQPPNRAPVALGRMIDRTLPLTAGPIVLEVAAAFADLDGDALTYEAFSSAPAVATVGVSASRVTVTPISFGWATITIKATDVGGSNSTATQDFIVTVFRGLPFIDHHGIRPGGVAPLKASHFLELRSRIAALRTEAGLPEVPWTDSTLTAGVTPVRGVHLTELRDAIDAAYSAAGHQPPRYTDPEVTVGVTPIRAVHMMELREAVLALEAAGGQSQAREAGSAAEGTTNAHGNVFTAVEPQAAGALQADQLTLRRRSVVIDFEALERVRAAVHPEGAPVTILLNLFDDAVVSGLVDRQEPNFFRRLRAFRWDRGDGTGEHDTGGERNGGGRHGPHTGRDVLDPTRRRGQTHGRPE